MRDIYRLPLMMEYVIAVRLKRQQVIETLERIFTTTTGKPSPAEFERVDRNITATIIEIEREEREQAEIPEVFANFVENELDLSPIDGTVLQKGDKALFFWKWSKKHGQTWLECQVVWVGQDKTRILIHYPSGNSRERTVFSNRVKPYRPHSRKSDSAETE